jgi:hypothetical protein
MTYLGAYIPDHIRITYRPKRKKFPKDNRLQKEQKDDLPPHVCKVCGKKLHPAVTLPLCVEHDDITTQGRKGNGNKIKKTV